MQTVPRTILQTLEKAIESLDGHTPAGTSPSISHLQAPVGFRNRLSLPAAASILRPSHNKALPSSSIFGLLFKLSNGNQNATMDLNLSPRSIPFSSTPADGLPEMAPLNSTSATMFEDASVPHQVQGSDFELVIRQQPDRARVLGGKKTGSHLIDPPPIVQVRMRDDGSDLALYLQSRYYFMACSLHDASADRPVVVAPMPLTGTLVSSLRRLKDDNNKDGSFCVFGDMTVNIDGEFRLQFSMFEMRDKQAIFLKSTISNRFRVWRRKDFPGYIPATPSHACLRRRR
ncbi:Velvet factor [Penicillium argentinense]|uniref:Velvet factor n=1 Tax=Penicillium argentinense TaxID=1131581 RepID=A0A9W9G2Z2_9EURO|nr:Velvet factor [Penicillium argentinense]KAJ5110690.1 Velvet factor [Penicillium argentinense]